MLKLQISNVLPPMPEVNEDFLKSSNTIDSFGEYISATYSQSIC